jgi:hypothetical protein
MTRKSKTDETSIEPKMPDPPVIISNPKLVRLGRGDGHSPPCLLYDGSVPNVGQEIKFALENGVTYSGIVADAVEVDGNVFVEFKDGIKPLFQK